MSRYQASSFAFEAFLSHILRVAWVAKNAAAGAVNQARVAPRDLVECLRVPVLVPLVKEGLVVRVHAVPPVVACSVVLDG